MLLQIGHRLCGSESLEEAVNRSIALLHAEGFDNVHRESVQLPRWVRGREHAELRSPRARPQPLLMLGLGNSIGTGKDGIEAEVLVVRNFTELSDRAQDVKGRIVVYNQYCDWVASPIDCYGLSVGYRTSGAAEAAKYGAVAALVRSVTGFSLATPHTGMAEGTTPIPTASLTVEDVSMLQRMQDRGQRITIFLYMEAQLLAPVTGHNVVAELTGSLYPNETVLVSGHLDSWDVGNGVMDDADGAWISWSALSLVKLAGLKPKRTMRLVLWSCEEFGGIGGQQYWNDHHAAELDTMDIVFESDLGVFHPLGLQLAANDKATAIVSQIGQLLSSINATQVVGGGEGTDIDNWLGAGVPGASLYSANERYFWYHHTNADRMEVMDRDDMDLAAATWAVFAYTLADIDAFLPRGTNTTMARRVMAD